MSASSVIVTVVLLAVNAVFVAYEFALVASQRARLEQMDAIDGPRGRAALAALRQLSRQLAGVQLGVTIASLALGAVAEVAVADALESAFGIALPKSWSAVLAFAVALTLVTFAHSVFGELVPRSLAMSSAEKTLLLLALPLSAFMTVARPLIVALNAVASGCLKLLGVQRLDELASVRSIDDLGVLVAHAAESGRLADAESQRLRGAIGIGAQTVEAVMIRRGDMDVLTKVTSVSEAEEAFTKSGRSRLPVVGRDLDHVLGFIHAKDLLAVDAAERNLAVPTRLIRRMLVVASGRPLDELLVSMRRARLHLALVLDRDGRTAGLVSLEDVLEELVGEILDESDRA